MSATSKVSQAIDVLGGPSAVAKLRGHTPWAISKWKTRLPAEHVLWLAELTRWEFTPHDLAPDLYPNQTDGLPKSARSSKEAA